MSFDFQRLSLDVYEGFGGNSKPFKCPNCSGLASHLWKYDSLTINGETKNPVQFAIIAQCQGCERYSIWLTDEIPIRTNETYGTTELFYTDKHAKLIFPNISKDAPLPNMDMPSDVMEIFIEASEVLNKSPRASAALSRLAIEKLVTHLGAKGKELNSQIGDLVSKGMPIQIQQMLDSVRVIGNNAVHPGQIDLKDNKELALSLLHFVNLIVDNQISQPKKISEVYDSLPESYRKAIKNRDK